MVTPKRELCVDLAQLAIQTEPLLPRIRWEAASVLRIKSIDPYRETIAVMSYKSYCSLDTNPLLSFSYLS